MVYEAVGHQGGMYLSYSFKNSTKDIKYNIGVSYEIQMLDPGLHNKNNLLQYAQDVSWSMGFESQQSRVLSTLYFQGKLLQRRVSLNRQFNLWNILFNQNYLYHKSLEIVRNQKIGHQPYSQHPYECIYIFLERDYIVHNVHYIDVSDILSKLGGLYLMVIKIILFFLTPILYRQFTTSVKMEVVDPKADIAAVSYEAILTQSQEIKELKQMLRKQQEQIDELKGH